MEDKIKELEYRLQIAELKLEIAQLEKQVAELTPSQTITSTPWNGQPYWGPNNVYYTNQGTPTMYGTQSAGYMIQAPKVDVNHSFNLNDPSKD